MNKSTTLRIAGFVGGIAVTAGLVTAAAGGTGAYFQDSKSGNQITGTAATISVDGSGGTGANHLNLGFTNLLPGEAQSKQVSYKNTGSAPQDVWVVFDKDKLGDGHGTSGINSLGHYASVHVASNGAEKFGSNNLNDDQAGCPAGTADCAPLPAQIKLQDNLAVGASGSLKFGFTPGAKFKNVQGAKILDLDYSLVATQHGITPDEVPAP